MEEALIKRILPHSIEAERSVISSMLMGREAIQAAAEIINGDRAAVREEADGFFAYGVPFCGSSRVCLNEKRRLRAVVFPEKADANEVVGLPPFEIFKRLIGCLSYTETDPVAQSSGIDAAERIAGRVPGFLLRCRPDEDAVETLARALDLPWEKK